MLEHLLQFRCDFCPPASRLLTLAPGVLQIDMWVRWESSR